MSDLLTYTGVQTPVGPVTITMQGGAVTALDWHKCAAPDSTDLARDVTAQLTQYFEGTRQSFDLPLAPVGSEFQRAFYDVLCAIPYGETREYGDIAKQMGRPAQAIGQACGSNPIAILIPCHRVLSVSGLGGFSAKGGVETKVMLLRLEGAASLLI